jgi:hypothetical protein
MTMASPRISFGRVDNFTGREIVRVRRVNYVNPDGTRDISRGPIEVTFHDDVVLRLESGSDGASIRLRVGEWRDPFAEPLSADNRDFVQSSGKWDVFDVSSDPDYRTLIGKTIGTINLLTLNDRIVGAELAVGSVLVRAEVKADELVLQMVLE